MMQATLESMDNPALYQLHELHRASVTPLRIFAHASKHLSSNPLNPLAYTGLGRSMAAGFELIERITQHYAKPEFGLSETIVDGAPVGVQDTVVAERPFCRLLHFKRDISAARASRDPKILVVAPMSGHYATLLRGTVKELLPYAEVYITDWANAREVPFFKGGFDLDDYITYVMEFIRFIGRDVHVIAVCQPAVPVFLATALMNEDKEPFAPKSMTLMGGPIDPRKAPTQVNRLATEKPLEWFERSVITRVPFNYPGFMRRVYPGFLQLSGFMQLNLDRHIGEHIKLFQHLVQGDGESAAAHRRFYDEYLSVADLPAEFYLQTIDKVFQRHLLPKNQFDYRGRIVNADAITQTAVLCVEGEKDDISGVGQTKAAMTLCRNLAEKKKRYHLQKGVGHYGIFNGRNYRDKILPVILEHIRTA
jgi:poly(3-hydroxybutyrate) depolymerase